MYLTDIINAYNSEAFSISEWLLNTIVIANESDLKELYLLHERYIEAGKDLMFDPYLSNNYLTEHKSV